MKELTFNSFVEKCIVCPFLTTNVWNILEPSEPPICSKLKKRLSRTEMKEDFPLWCPLKETKEN